MANKHLALERWALKFGFQKPPLRSVVFAIEDPNELRYKEMLGWEKFWSHNPSSRTMNFKDRINMSKLVSLRDSIELQSCITETNF